MGMVLCHVDELALHPHSAAVVKALVTLMQPAKRAVVAQRLLKDGTCVSKMACGRYSHEALQLLLDTPGMDSERSALVQVIKANSGFFSGRDRRYSNKVLKIIEAY